MTTNTYLRGVREHSWQPVERRLWQRNYYEHVLRSDHDLRLSREYVVNNPAGWTADAENIFPPAT